MPPGLLQSLARMSAGVKLDHRIETRSEDLVKARPLLQILSEDELRSRGFRALLLPPLNISSLLSRLAPKTPMICAQKEHPAEARISILKAQLIKNRRDLEKAATPLVFDQLLLDKFDMESKIEDLENDVDLWRVDKRGAGTKFLVVRQIIVYQDVAMRIDVYKSANPASSFDEGSMDGDYRKESEDDGDDEDDGYDDEEEL